MCYYVVGQAVCHTVKQLYRHATVVILLFLLFCADEVVVLTEDMDKHLVALSGASGQKHLGLAGKAAPLKRSLRRAALDALAEASNYP